VKCPLGKVTLGKRKIPTGEFRSGKLPPSLVRVVANDRDRNGNDDGGISRSGSGSGGDIAHRNGRVLDFTVTITTSLKILLIGDSVMVQLGQAFDEMIMSNGQYATTEDPIHREIVWEAWRGHNGGTVVSPTRGGGVSAMWRMTGLLSRRKKGKPPANSAGGGWSDKEIDSFLGYSTPKQRQQQQNNSTVASSTATTIGKFDVVVFRVMHGWMKIHEITRDGLLEAIELAHELLGATTVVLMTIPFTNNVKTPQVLKQVNDINDEMRDIARRWHRRGEDGENGEGNEHSKHSGDSGVQRVLVLEYGTYYNHIVWSNGLHLGYNVTPPLRATRTTFDDEAPGFVFDRLKDAGEWAPSIPMVCSDKALLGADRKKCNRNYLFSDGMHTCPESLASRYAAGLACLIGCVYNGRSGNDDDPERESKLRACERECNEQFLSVVPVEESWVDTNTTLASFSR